VVGDLMKKVQFNTTNIQIVLFPLTWVIVWRVFDTIDQSRLKAGARMEIEGQRIETTENVTIPMKDLMTIGTVDNAVDATEVIVIVVTIA